MKKSTRETTPMPSKKKQVKVRKGKVSEIPSERLKKCFAAGNVIALFAVLKDWPLEELKAAGEDLQLFHDVAVKGIGLQRISSPRSTSSNGARSRKLPRLLS